MLSATKTALTGHFVTAEGYPGKAVLARAAAELKADFGTGHVTLQPELNSPTAEHRFQIQDHRCTNATIRGISGLRRSHSAQHENFV